MYHSLSCCSYLFTYTGNCILKAMIRLDLTLWKKKINFAKSVIHGWVLKCSRCGGSHPTMVNPPGSRSLLSFIIRTKRKKKGSRVKHQLNGCFYPATSRSQDLKNGRQLGYMRAIQDFCIYL